MLFAVAELLVTADTLRHSVTFDLERLQYVGCDVVKPCAKLEQNRTICSEVIVISVFNLMTVNM